MYRIFYRIVSTADEISLSIIVVVIFLFFVFVFDLQITDTKGQRVWCCTSSNQLVLSIKSSEYRIHTCPSEYNWIRILAVYNAQQFFGIHPEQPLLFSSVICIIVVNVFYQVFLSICHCPFIDYCSYPQSVLARLIINMRLIKL